MYLRVTDGPSSRAHLGVIKAHAKNRKRSLCIRRPSTVAWLFTRSASESARERVSNPLYEKLGTHAQIGWAAPISKAQSRRSLLSLLPIGVFFSARKCKSAASAKVKLSSSNASTDEFRFATT
jgi:hypothetical protein